MTAARDTTENHAATVAMLDYLRGNSNWGRWGTDDQRGALNLIDDAQRLRAAACVRIGRSYSLSKPYPKTATPMNPEPAEHRFWTTSRPDGANLAFDRYGIDYHGFATTHIDALCHVWRDDGMWNGRDPNQAVTAEGARWGDIEQWADGVIARGVLLDVPSVRGTPHVAVDQRITAADLEAAERRQGVRLRPGDALVLYGGRDRWERDNPAYTKDQPRPGLDWSCLRFLRERDVAVLCWDFHEASPTGTDLTLTLHLAICYFGIALVDNASLGELASACAERQQYDFQFIAAPLRVAGGSGSPVNPIAVL